MTTAPSDHVLREAFVYDTLEIVGSCTGGPAVAVGAGGTLLGVVGLELRVGLVVHAVCHIPHRALRPASEGRSIRGHPASEGTETT